jgi:hypothetical protein
MTKHLSNTVTAELSSGVMLKSSGPILLTYSYKLTDASLER